MPTTNSFPHVQGHQFMNLTTYRKTGVAVSTPVWFAQEGDRLYLYTQANSGKVKRVRNSNKVEVAPCDRTGKVLGASQTATARLLSPEEGRHADQLLTQKYGWMKRVFTFFAKLRRSQPAYLEVRPA